MLALRSVKFRIRSSRRRATPTRRRVTLRCKRTHRVTSRIVAFGVTMEAMTGHRKLRTAFVPGPEQRMGNSTVRVRFSLFGGKGGVFISPRSPSELDRRTCCFVKNLLTRDHRVALVAGPLMGSCGHLMPKFSTPARLA